MKILLSFALSAFLSAILGVSNLFAPPVSIAEKFITLNKDEFYLLTLQAREAAKTLFFRWTLLKNEGLVMHLNYDSFPHQFILYQDYQRRCYKVPLLKPEQKYYSEEPFFMLCFKDYHRTKKVATLKYYLYQGNRDFNIIDERKVPNGGFNTY